MNAATIAALATAIVSIITAVTALVHAIKTGNSVKAATVTPTQPNPVVKDAPAPPAGG